MPADLPSPPPTGSLWYFPPWTNEAWSGPWVVVGIANHYGKPAGAHPQSDCNLPVVLLVRVDGPPERLSTDPHEVELDRWPANWEPWPEESR